MKPSITLVPFAYPDYPQDVVQRFIESSSKMIGSLDVTLTVTAPVVVADDAEEVRRQIRDADSDLIVALLVTWVEAPNLVATLRDFFGRPLLLWSHTTYREGDEIITLGPIPAAGVIRETLEEMEVRFKFIYGPPDSAAVGEQIASSARVASAVRALSRARVGLFGYASMGMYTGTFDQVKVRRLLGPEIFHFGQYFIIKAADKMKDEQVGHLVERAKSDWHLGPEVSDTNLIRTMKVYAALDHLRQEHKLDALTVKCQYEMSRLYKLAPCIPLSMLADQIPASCEGDVPLILSQLILHYLSDGQVTGYGDVHDVTEDGIIFAACGFAPLSLLDGKPEVHAHTALYEGLMTTSSFRQGPITLARLASDREGFKMHIATGQARPMPKYHEIGCPQYAGMRVILNGEVNAFMQHLASQHYAIVYGDLKEEIVELCQQLSIRPVVS